MPTRREKRWDQQTHTGNPPGAGHAGNDPFRYGAPRAPRRQQCGYIQPGGRDLRGTVPRGARGRWKSTGPAVNRSRKSTRNGRCVQHTGPHACGKETPAPAGHPVMPGPRAQAEPPLPVKETGGRSQATRFTCLYWQCTPERAQANAPNSGNCTRTPCCTRTPTGIATP